jgi:C4-dicarboxylate transporter/malic acid transport protein
MDPSAAPDPAPPPAQPSEPPTILRHFSPAWFAAVMGTAVVPLAISFLSLDLVRPLAGFFTGLSALMFVGLLIPWTLRFVLHPEEVRRDLDHPVAANFFPTMPISLIILALDLLKFPDLFFDEGTSRRIAFALWLVGTIGIYLMGFVVLPRVYRHPGIEVQHANFGWYIPPVSKLLIPVAGLELAAIYPDRFELTFGISMVSLGVGFFLFVFVGATVYHRYVFQALPASRLAATSFIGIAPTAIIAVVLFKLIALMDASPVTGLDAAAVETLATLGILVAWGFSAWAFVMAVVIVASYVRRLDLPYALSWWAFTFPTGALAVATGVAWQATGFGWIHGSYRASVIVLLVIWLAVAANTVRGVISRKVFVPSH